MATTGPDAQLFADRSARTPYARTFLLLFAVAVLTAGCRIERHARTRAIDPADLEAPALTAVLTVVYHVRDLDAAREWYSRALEVDPYRVEPAYVGFRLGASELGLDADTTTDTANAGAGATIAYWAVDDIDREVRRFIDLGATARTPVRVADNGLRLAVLVDPFGNAIGLMQEFGSASAGSR